MATAQSKLPAALDAAIIDEIGDLELELSPHRPKIARLDALRKKVREHYADSEADSFFEANGTRYALLIGAKANEKHLNIPKLAKALGAKLFYSIASVTLKALREAGVADDVVAGVTTEAPTGSRSLKLLAKAGA